MSDTFTRGPDDNTSIERLGDWIVLTIGRPGAIFDNTSLGTDWQKAGDAPLVRRWDNPDLEKSPEASTRRPNDNATVTRLPVEDYFRRV